MQMSKQCISALTARPLRTAADTKLVTAASTPAFDSAVQYRALFAGQDLNLLINQRDGSYLIAHRSTQRQATLAGQRADQLAKSLDRISLNFRDLSDPKAELRFVRLVEVVLEGFLELDEILSSWRKPSR